MGAYIRHPTASSLQTAETGALSAAAAAPLVTSAASTPPTACLSNGGSTDPYAAHRRQALIWITLIPSLVAFCFLVAFCVVPRPPAAMGFFWPPRERVGLSRADVTSIAALAALFTALIIGSQEVLLRPFLPESPATTDALFWGTSCAVRAVFFAVLGWHHYGPSSHDAAATGDTGYRTVLMGLWYAAYSADLIQVFRRPGGVSKAFVAQMVPHHVISLAWFGLWMLTLAPGDAGGAPIWNTVRCVLAWLLHLKYRQLAGTQVDGGSCAFSC